MPPPEVTTKINKSKSEFFIKLRKETNLYTERYRREGVARRGEREATDYD